MLSFLLRFLRAGIGAVAAGVTEVAGDGAGGVITGAAAGFGVVSGAIVGSAVCALSTLVAVWGADDVETGGAPLPTDSLQPVAAVMTASDSARRTKVRVLKGSIVKGDLCVHGEARRAPLVASALRWV